MSKAWGGAGAWALEAALDNVAAPAKYLIAGLSEQSFPSLREAASTKSKKKNKPVSLFQIQLSSAVAPGPFRARRERVFESKGLTLADFLRLPTGPRERSPEELEQCRLSGGFQSCGGIGGGFPNRRSCADGLWSAPSKADEADNWGAGKKPMIADFGRRQDRHGSFGADSSSRADEVDNWASSKKPLPTRYSNFCSGFSGYSNAHFDRRRRGREESMPTNGERHKLVLDPPKRDIVASIELDPPKRNIVESSELVKNRPSPFGTARPREDVLTEKGVDWKKIDSENDVKNTSRPSTAQSSRPSSPREHTTLSVEPAEVASKPRSKVNPFGDAKPREVVLQEKGNDRRKLDQDIEHHVINRPETEKEIEIKNDINLLKELAKEADGEELSQIKESLAIIENELRLLTRELDNKVKFGYKAISNDRPGSTTSEADAIS